MKLLSGKGAAITGAASGIGRATAVRLAREGCHVALADIDEAGLEATRVLCSAYPVKVQVARVDVADRAAVERWALEAEAQLGGVHILVNNAGVALGATIEAMRYEDFEWLMNINFWGVVHGTKAFLPCLRRAGEGHIVNVSSVFGLIGVPTQGAYNAAKFAVKGFTEALRQELEVEACGIGVTSVHPGGIQTNIAKSARMTVSPGWVDAASGSEFERAFTTTAERAAEDIVRAIRHNRRRQLIGPDARLIDWMQRLFPTGYQRVLVAFLRRRRKKLLARGA